MYVAVLKELARFCQYEAKREEEIELTFLVGLANWKHAAQVLLLGDNSTLAATILKAMTLESANRVILDFDT